MEEPLAVGLSVKMLNQMFTKFLYLSQLAEVADMDALASVHAPNLEPHLAVEKDQKIGSQKINLHVRGHVETPWQLRMLFFFCWRILLNTYSQVVSGIYVAGYIPRRNSSPF